MLSKKTTVVTVTYKSEDDIEYFLDRIKNEFKIIVFSLNKKKKN